MFLVCSYLVYRLHYGCLISKADMSNPNGLLSQIFTELKILLSQRFYLNKDWGCVILREIDFLLKIC